MPATRAFLYELAKLGSTLPPNPQASSYPRMMVFVKPSPLAVAYVASETAVDESTACKRPRAEDANAARMMMVEPSIIKNESKGLVVED